MNLSPPVTKKSYNDHLIQIKKAAVEHARIQMQDAAIRSFGVTKTKHLKKIDVQFSGVTMPILSTH